MCFIFAQICLSEHIYNGGRTKGLLVQSLTTRNSPPSIAQGQEIFLFSETSTRMAPTQPAVQYKRFVFPG